MKPVCRFRSHRVAGLKKIVSDAFHVRRITVFRIFSTIFIKKYRNGRRNVSVRCYHILSPLITLDVDDLVFGFRDPSSYVRNKRNSLAIKDTNNLFCVCARAGMLLHSPSNL